MDIRKISIGPDYKNGAMHYIVGQRILNETYEIYLIKHDSYNNLCVYIINKKSEVVLWKQFSSTMPISIEFNIDY